MFCLQYSRKYHDAISYYERALELSTTSLSTYSGLAYTYHLQALWLKPEDQFCGDMLSLAVLDEARSGTDPKFETRMSEVFV
ncbi:Anaphase-promoting complex subunit 6 [Linum perenne]